IYEGVDLPSPEIRYVDYAHWINNMEGQPDKQKQFWKKELAAPLPFLDMPVVRDRADDNNYGSSTKVLTIDGGDYQQIKKIARNEKVSDFMFMLSAYYILLSKISGNTDIIIGTDVIGRTQPSLKNIVGTFVNILPLRLYVGNELHYKELLAQVKKCVIKAYENQDYQYDQMKVLVNGVGMESQNDIVKVHFSFANIVENNIESADFESFPLQSRKNEMSEYEFKLEVREMAGKLNISFIYHKFLYEDETIDLLMKYYSTILSAISDETSITIEDIDMIKPACALA
ncbi:MAG: condensation domain-containing protein, partial [Chitinophagaceae bacterium]